MGDNPIKRYRESLHMNKSELTRKVDVPPLTISCVESGTPCRVETQRKILFALDLDLSDNDKVFLKFDN